MSDFGEMIFGKEWVEKMAKMSEEYHQLDLKYPEILDEGDTFEKHLMVYWNEGRWKLRDTEMIPARIQSEMRAIFLKYFEHK